MPTIEQTDIYKRIAQNHPTVAGQVAYDFPEFQMDLMEGGLVKTLTTVKSKWLSSIADGVVIPRGAKPFALGVLDADRLRELLTLSDLKKTYTHTYTYIQPQTGPCIHPGDRYEIIGGDEE